MVRHRRATPTIDCRHSGAGQQVRNPLTSGFCRGAQTPGQAMNEHGPLPTATQRQFMQRLRTDQWRRLAAVSAAAGDRLLASMIAHGWLERRGAGQEQEVWLTIAGLEALRTPLRIHQ